MVHLLDLSDDVLLNGNNRREGQHFKMEGATRVPCVEHRVPLLSQNHTSPEGNSQSSTISVNPRSASLSAFQLDHPRGKQGVVESPDTQDISYALKTRRQLGEMSGNAAMSASQVMQDGQANLKLGQTAPGNEIQLSTSNQPQNMVSPQSDLPRPHMRQSISRSAPSKPVQASIHGPVATNNIHRAQQRLPLQPATGSKRTTFIPKPKTSIKTINRVHTVHTLQPSTPVPAQRLNPLAAQRQPDRQRTPLHQASWREWPEIRVRFSGLHAGISAGELRECLAELGDVAYVELYEKYKGKRDGNGLVEFRPPPVRPFWEERPYFIDVPNKGRYGIHAILENRRSPTLYAAPGKPERKYLERMELQGEHLDFGIMLEPTTMMYKNRIKATPGSPIKFGLNMKFRELVIEFPLLVQKPRAPGIPATSSHQRSETMRFRVPFSSMQDIYVVPAPEMVLELFFTLENPPKFFKKLDGSFLRDDAAKQWFESDMWYRQTDVVYSPGKLKTSPVTLNKSSLILDLGRWTTYRLTVRMTKADEDQFEQMRIALQDYNVDILPFKTLKLVPSKDPIVWKLIDPPPALDTPDGGRVTTTIQSSAAKFSFGVRYQLEVCISHGILDEHNISEAFINKLSALNETTAIDLLEFMATQKDRTYDPMSIFKMEVPSSSSSTNMPYYCALVRSVTVTPTRLRFNSPTVETSNRIIRQYPNHIDRFIRVRFTDESTEGKIYSTHKDTENEVFTRIKRTMANGIMVADRHYRFLAFGNSQFREHGAYFFAPTANLTTEQIRLWMGSFTHIHGVALFAARLGQCFSTTRAIATQTEVIEIADIQRNKFQFSDGVGKISPILAQIAADDLGLTQKAQDPPSVFQFRLGGCKGVLAVWPELTGKQLHIRETQYKFPASHEGLEIIRWSQYACANLNRQLILVLSALGVPDSVFMQKLKNQLEDIDEAMNDPDKALEILQRNIDHNQMTLKIAGIILDGFQGRDEPFIVSLLQLWRSWSIKYLKEKARIMIHRGALLIGCLDERGVLKGHFNDAPLVDEDATVAERAKSVPEIFVQLSKGPEGKAKVMLGPMLLARNPSLHPGDIRVVCGVDKSELRHLKDCVVLPQTGDRDVASMCSGGDLDGDDFEVIWDQDLLPTEWNHEPMDYSAPEKRTQNRDITDDDLTTFFITYMKNDTLPRIALSHVANADGSDHGVKDEKCLRLAALHSMAVDFVKTGHPAEMSRDLQPRKWPHFMEKKHMRDDQIYISRKILGQLYDRVERVAFIPAFTKPFDERILNAYDLDQDMLNEARMVKKDYDTHMYRIMAQHAIGTEFEVWSTFVMSHNSPSDYKFGEEIGRISIALKEQFKKVCRQKAGGEEYNQIAPFVVAMYRVTADEMAVAVKECSQEHKVNGRKQPIRQMNSDSMPLMSFPWLFDDVLGKIAKHNAFGPGQADPTLSLIDGSHIIRRSAPSTTSKPVRPAAAASDFAYDLRIGQGVTHKGDLLELDFGDSNESPSARKSQASRPLHRTEGSFAAQLPPILDLDKIQQETLALNSTQAMTQDATRHEDAIGASVDSSAEEEEIVQLGERGDSMRTKLSGFVSTG